jgi:DNA mismatch repair ATPase MutL
MIDIVSLSCFSIIGKVYQTSFPGQLITLISHYRWKKNKKRYENLLSALDKLEQVGCELEAKIHGHPTHVDILALRLLDIVECRKIIFSEANKDKGNLNIVVDKLNQIKEKWEERIKGQPVMVEELRVMVSEVEECKNLITKKMHSLGSPTFVIGCIG